MSHILMLMILLASSCAFNVKHKLSSSFVPSANSVFKEKTVRIRVFQFYNKIVDQEYLLSLEHDFIKELKDQGPWKTIHLIQDTNIKTEEMNKITTYDDLNEKIEVVSTDYQLDIFLYEKKKRHWRDLLAILTLSLIPGHKEYEYEVEMILRNLHTDKSVKTTSKDEYSLDYSIIPYGGLLNVNSEEERKAGYKLIIRDSIVKLSKLVTDESN